MNADRLNSDYSKLVDLILEQINPSISQILQILSAFWRFRIGKKKAKIKYR